MTGLQYSIIFCMICGNAMAKQVGYINEVVPTNIQGAFKKNEQVKRITQQQYEALNSKEQLAYYEQIKKSLSPDFLTVATEKNSELEHLIKKLLDDTLTKQTNLNKNSHRGYLCNDVYQKIVGIMKSLYPEFSGDVDTIDFFVNDVYTYRIIDMCGNDAEPRAISYNKIIENGMYYIYIYPPRPDIVNFTPFVIPYNGDDLFFAFPE